MGRNSFDLRSYEAGRHYATHASVNAAYHTEEGRADEKDHERCDRPHETQLPARRSGSLRCHRYSALIAQTNRRGHASPGITEGRKHHRSPKRQTHVACGAFLEDHFLMKADRSFVHLILRRRDHGVRCPWIQLEGRVRNQLGRAISISNGNDLVNISVQDQGRDVHFFSGPRSYRSRRTP
jgi:hypothetical protein